MKILTLLLTFFIVWHSTAHTKTYDIAIINAKVFDTITGKVRNNKTILISAGTIVNVIDNQNKFVAKMIIDAKGKLITPGFIDTHIHPTDVFGDYDKAPQHLEENSSVFFRKKLSDIYLPYGVTTAMIMGQPTSWLKPILSWSSHPLPNYTDIYYSGRSFDFKRRPEVLYKSYYC